MMLDRRVIRCVTVLAAMIGRLGTGVIANSALAGDDAEASQVVGGSQATGNAVQPKSQGRFVIQAETVDPQGKPLSGVELALAVYDASGTGRTEPRIEAAISDGQGRGRFDVAPKRPGERPLYAYVRAYDPGRALAMPKSCSAKSRRRRQRCDWSWMSRSSGRSLSWDRMTGRSLTSACCRTGCGDCRDQAPSLWPTRFRANGSVD